LSDCLIAAKRNPVELRMTASNYVLLTNAKSDKGFDLFLQVARLAPNISFLAIASQSELRIAESASSHIPNVHIVDRVEEMAPLYAAARVVAVPSYKFRETFSRVCIEAHRYGKPVIGSDQANVPYLLSKSGIVLPPDAAAWAAELTRLYNDESYYGWRSSLARENSIRYPYVAQRQAIQSIVRAVSSSTLVAVGSGLGNMLHATPMIRNIARRMGAPLDIVVAQDHASSLFLLHNPKYVNAVYSLTQTALRRNYRTAFVTHSFGVARVAFLADKVIWSRDWRSFRADGMHETRFNLEAMKHLLGIPYEEEDVSGYFVGDLDYTPPEEPLIGFHAGSKSGVWLAKRWPYFAELGSRLKQRGYRVASFGTHDEYVEGTEDRTGGSIEQMCEAVLECTHFVSNDSGLMNIANGLGIPTLAIFGPTNVRTRLPLRPTTVAVNLEKDCAPCEVKNPKHFAGGDCSCIGEISVERVEEGLIRLMLRGKASSSADLQQYA